MTPFNVDFVKENTQIIVFIACLMLTVALILMPVFS